MRSSAWSHRPFDKDRYYLFLKEGGLTPFLANFFVKRGFSDLKEAYRYLFPRLEDFVDPFLLPEMDLAVKRIEKSLLSQERIGIYGDSDADGILGTFILHHFLSRVAPKPPVVYFADRLTKGYGFHPEAIPFFKNQGVGLVITVDVGVSEGRTVELAKLANLDVIVTDHHEFQELPRAITITGKRAKNSPLYHLCGAGVALQLVKALRTYLYQRGYFSGREIPKLRPYLEIAALATMADMVPLVGENRLITYFGYRDLSQPSFPGLELLLKGLKYGVNERDLSLTIIPRINACFRLGRPELFFDFLKEEDQVRVEILFKEIEGLNEERKNQSSSLWEEIFPKLKDAERESFVLLYQEGVPRSQLGLLAQRVKNFTKKPAIILTNERNGLLVGSARSPEGLDLLALLREKEDLFCHLGGHALAFGLKIEEDRLLELIFYLEWRLKGLRPPALKTIALDYEGRVSEFLEEDNLLALKQLPPYGEGHEPPMVLLKGFEVGDKRIFKDRHTQLILREGSREVRAILFNKILDNEPILLVGTPYINTYTGSLEFQIEDFKHDLF